MKISFNFILFIFYFFKIKMQPYFMQFNTVNWVTPQSFNLFSRHSILYLLSIEIINGNLYEMQVTHTLSLSLSLSLSRFCKRYHLN